MKLMFFVGFACVSGTAFAYNSRKEAKIGTKFTIRRGSAEDLKMQEKIGRKRLGDLAEQLLEKLFKFSWQIKPICQQVRDMFIAEHQGSTRHRPRAYYARPDSTHITKYLFEKGKSDREALTESIENAVKNICNPKTYYITIDGNEYVNYCYPLPRIDYVKGFKLDHKLVTEEIRDYAIFTRTFALTMLIGGMVSDESLLAQLSEYELEIKDLVNQMAQDRSSDCEIFVSEKMFDSCYLSYSWILEIFDSMRSLCSSENSRLKAFIGKIRSTETTDKELLGLLCVDVEMNRPRVKEVLAKLRNEHGVTAQ